MGFRTPCQVGRDSGGRRADRGPERLCGRALAMVARDRECGQGPW